MTQNEEKMMKGFKTRVTKPPSGEGGFDTGRHEVGRKMDINEFNEEKLYYEIYAFCPRIM